MAEFRTTLELYRDCMRLANHVGKDNGPGGIRAIKAQVRSQFKKNLYETDQKKIEEQREAAVRALTNYFVYYAQQLTKEEQLKRGISGKDLQQ